MNLSLSSLSDYASYAKNVALTATTLVAGTELEKKLTEATSNEPWGASGTMLTEISRATFSYEDFKTIMSFAWKNLQLSGSLWRVVYKTLNMIDHMVRNGSDRVIEDCRDHLSEIKAKLKFEFVDAEGKAHQKVVTTGPRGGAGIVITDGLGADETVVIEGMQKLRDGTQTVPPEVMLQAMEAKIEKRMGKAAE